MIANDNKVEIITEVLEYLLSLEINRSEEMLSSHLKTRYDMTERGADSIIHVMSRCKFIAPNGNKFLIQPEGIHFLLDNRYKEAQLGITKKQNELQLGLVILTTLAFILSIFELLKL